MNIHRTMRCDACNNAECLALGKEHQNMGYITYVRKMVGHKPIVVCGASVLLFNKGGELLLERRLDDGCWGYAGGTVEIDEKVEDATKRELYEETGLIAKSLSLFGVFSGKELHHIYPNGDELSIIDVVFICRSYEGTLVAQKDEVSDLRFFSINNLPENIIAPSIPVINALKASYEQFFNNNASSDS